MLKIDIDATMSSVRAAMEASGALPGQDACELACNRDGIDAAIAFARWTYELRDNLDGNEYADAIGMLIGSMVVGALGNIDADDQPKAVIAILNMMVGQINRSLAGERVDGDVTVDPVTYDVGDA